jgi:FixJ family two-component response regulator
VPFCPGVYFSPMTNGNCIFLVDDDSSARKGLARLLRAAGYGVRDFASAKDFLDVLGSEASGCLVLDARMSGISNEEVLEELKARHIHLPIIVVTGDDDSETRQKAQKMKAAGFFRKPVDGPALLDAINWALQTNMPDVNKEKV